MNGDISFFISIYNRRTVTTDADSRVRGTNYIMREAEGRGLAWA